MKQEIPVFLISGFLESGKTTFISNAILNPDFRIRGNTLLFLCEEGIEEYDEAKLKACRTIPIVVEDEEDLTPAFMEECALKHKAMRAIIEWNGMWDPQALKLPEGFMILQQLMMIDAGTFSTYYQNGDMRSILTRLALNAETIFLNRCRETYDLQAMKMQLKSINSMAELVFEDMDGNEFGLPFTDDELPYDISAPVVEISPEHYGLFFVDLEERFDRYEGLKVRYTAMVNKPAGFRKDQFYLCRPALNGCADPNCGDSNCQEFLLGYICKYKNAYGLKNGAWITVTAEIHIEKHSAYPDPGPVLYAMTAEPAAPIREYVTM